MNARSGSVSNMSAAFGGTRYPVSLTAMYPRFLSHGMSCVLSYEF
jgi:hypothetical protein